MSLLIKEEDITFNATDGQVIHGHKWLPSDDRKIKALIIINHGMAEHMGRYGHFASHLAENGYAVFGEDHRGHGATAAGDDDLGFFAPTGGWNRIVEDVRSLHLSLKEQYPGLPVIMFGHSMGSFITRTYISRFGRELAGCILTGTGYNSGLLAAAGRLVCNREIRKHGLKYRSALLDRMSFGSFNKPFRQDGNTGFEWLSRDNEVVGTYAADPKCGFISTTAMFSDILDGVHIINSRDTFTRTPKDLPLLMVSGSRDPVGDFGKGVRKVEAQFRKAGIRDLTVHLIEDARHVCLDEIGREDTYQLIVNWIQTRKGG